MVSPRRKILLVVMVAAASVVLLAYVSVLIYAMHEVHRMTEMLNDAAQVKVGGSESSILPMIRKYNAVKWTPDPLPSKETWIDTEEYDYQQKLKVDYNYGMAVSAFVAEEQTGNIASLISSIGNKIPPTWRRRLGIRIWFSNLQFSIRDGRVQSILVRTIVEGRTQWLGHEWSLSERMPQSDMKERPYLIGAANLTMFYGDLFGGSAVTNYLLPVASEQEEHTARDFNHSCIVGLKICNDLEDLAPQAFDYLRMHPDAAWNILPPKPSTQ